jgi:hypothetical protein
MFQPGAFLRKAFGERLHRAGNKLVRLLNRAARFVDKAGLHVLPALPQPFRLIAGEERRATLVRRGCVTFLTLGAACACKVCG